MGFFASAYARKSATSEEIWMELYGGRKSSSGRRVNVDTAISVSAVFACNRVIGNGIAQPPLKLMRESADGKTRMPAKDHPLYNLLAMKPNRWQTSFQWRQMMSWHVELTGNHYSFINRIGNRVMELFPLMPNTVEKIDLGRGRFEYKVTAPNGAPETFPSESILHIHGPSWDGVRGLDIIRVARDAIGLAMATEESAAALHKNGIRPSGVYSVEGILKEDQYQRLAKWLQEEYGGPENADKPMILDRAAKWIATQMSGVDAQALETRRYQVEEICRFHGVMPIMAGYSDKTATYASVEQMFIAHDRDCLGPRWTSYEQDFDTQLLTERERAQGLYFDFVEEGRIRGAMKDTKDTILGYVNGGILTPNEGRALLDKNPDPDPASDQLRIPANITGSVPEPTETPKE